MTHPRNTTVEQALTVYHTFWTTLLQVADPFWFHADLTISQIKCLVLLEIRKDLTLGGIADALGMGLPFISVLIEQLVQAQFVTRCADRVDRRRRIVRLTCEGTDLARKIFHDKEQLMTAAFGTLPASDLAALTMGLKALAAAMAEAATGRTPSVPTAGEGLAGARRHTTSSREPLQVGR